MPSVETDFVIKKFTQDFFFFYQTLKEAFSVVEMALSSSRALPSHSLLPFCFSIPRFSLSHQYGGGGRQRTRPHGMLSGCCQSLGFQTTVEPVIIIYRIVAKGLLCIHFGNMLYGGKAERPIWFFCLLVL